LSIQTNSIGTIGTRILSLDGQVMLEQMMEANTPLDISSFAAGVYVVEITHGDQVWRTKWMKY
jgi:hypothetical protein